MLHGLFHSTLLYSVHFSLAFAKKNDYSGNCQIMIFISAIPCTFPEELSILLHVFLYSHLHIISLWTQRLQLHLWHNPLLSVFCFSSCLELRQWESPHTDYYIFLTCSHIIWEFPFLLNQKHVSALSFPFQFHPCSHPFSSRRLDSFQSKMIFYKHKCYHWSIISSRLSQWLS